MTQQVFDDIDPNVTSGTELATFLNEFKASLLTTHSGPVEPSYKLVGTSWLDSSVAGKLTLKNYDGTQWVTEYTIDTVAHTISFGGNNPTASFTINRTDTAADMLEMFRDTGIQTNAGLIFSQQNDSSIKKTFAKFKMVSDSVANGSEQASFLYEALVAGTLVTMASISNTVVNFKALAGSGERALSVDSNGNITASSSAGTDNIFANGRALNADLGTYVVTAPLVLIKSATAADLIDSTSVFRATSTAGSEIFETGSMAVPNGFIDSPIIISMKYKCGDDWTIELMDADLDTVIKTSVLNRYSPSLNESSIHKFFHLLPSSVANVKIRYTSTAADNLYFDDIQVYSWANKDEPLYFNEEVLNNVSNQNLFDILNRKNDVIKIDARILRYTDSNLADAACSLDASFDRNGLPRTGNETCHDYESLEVETSFNIDGDTLRYSTSDITGANYVGRITGRITRIL